MTIRTTNTTVTFSHPFTLANVEGVRPRGTYAVETDEELIPDISFPAYRRVGTRITLAADPRSPGITETMVVNPRDLDAALMGDAVQNGSSRLAELHQQAAARDAKR